jgi:hypothetical protein
VSLLSGKIFDPAAGRESRSAFIAQAAFWFAAFKFLTSGVNLKLGAYHINLGSTDATLLAAFLVPCLALYWGRRVYGPMGNKRPEPGVTVPGNSEKEAVG